MPIEQTLYAHSKFFRPLSHTNGNLFAYAANNPVKYTDPDGQWLIIDDIFFSAVELFFGNQEGDASTIFGLIKEFFKGIGSSFIHSWTYRLEHYILIIEYANDIVDLIENPPQKRSTETWEMNIGGGENGGVKLGLKTITEKTKKIKLPDGTEIPNDNSDIQKIDPNYDSEKEKEKKIANSRK